MATLASSQVTGVYLDQPIPMPGFHIEVWRVASGGANGDTATIAPKRGRFVVSAIGGPASNNLSSNGANANVTLTISTGTNTVGSFDVQLLIQE